jgi:hypothetical protein
MSVEALRVSEIVYSNEHPDRGADQVALRQSS